MNFSRTFSTMDAQTADEPLRIVISGISPILGKTILEKRRYAKEQRDYTCKMLLWESRDDADIWRVYYRIYLVMIMLRSHYLKTMK